MNRTMFLVLAAALPAVSIDADLSAQSWWQVNASGPSLQHGHTMAYDSQRDVTVLLGRQGDTWEWDGNSWTQVASTGPSPRYSHAMVYDSARGVSVMFGGRAVAGVALLGDTWEWDGTSWAQVATSGPGARDAHAMAYDSARGVTVLYGGAAAIGTVGDTWEWDGTSWTLRTPFGPSARSRAVMAYDSQRGVTTLFGGMAFVSPILGFSYFGETWEWNGSIWTLRASSGPLGRVAHAMVYDSFRGVVVMFGGKEDLLGAQVLGDTWQWGGSAWWPVAFAGPPQRAYHAMAFDSARRTTVMCGGVGQSISQFGDTWQLGSPVPARALTYGSGCGSPPLTLFSLNSPKLGSTAACAIGSAPTLVGAVALGFDNSTANGQPLPLELVSLGMPGCFQLTSAELFALPVTVLPATGNLQFQLAIPNDALWLGLNLYLQSYYVAPGANPLGVVVSNGIQWTVGNP